MNESDIIEAIRARMAAGGVSIHRLAAEAGVAYSYCQGVRAREHSPTLEYLAKIMAPLGLELRVVSR